MAVNPGEHPVILTPDQRVRVFVSSASELAPERRAVQDAVRRLRLLPVMVEDGARVHPSRDVHRAYLDQSQIFIGVYGDSWGEALDDEFRLSEHLPRLVYVKEPAPARDERLATMLSDIRRDAGLSYRLFTTAAQLRDLVEQDLAVLLSERFDGPAEPSRAAPVAGLPPAVRTPLIGREDDLAALVAMLDTDPLVTLTGPGGVGKTRLALAAADHCGPGFPDGVRFVDLSTVTSPDLVGEALARGLGVRTSGAVPASTDVASWLRTKRMLLVVDNFEQLAAAAPVIGQLQRAAPGVTALVTSRAPLRLAEERVFEVRPLPPPRGADADSPAVRLFVEVARAKVPGFALGPDDLAAVAEITRRLHGLPLAIVLAAAKVRLLPPATLVTHLGDQLGLLTGGARDLPDRQRTLRDTIAWSYRLLRAEEQAVFERLGVFAGGWDLAAAEAVAAPDGDLLDLLEGLIDSTLVRPVTASDGHERFAMLETIREYALERMRGGDQWHTAHAAHAAHYLRVAQAAQPHLNRAQATVWLRRLELERENVNAALDWFLTHDEPTQALRLLWATWSFWWRRGHIDEASRVVARILDHGDLLGDPATGRALLGAGVLSFVSGQPERAEGLFLRALPYLRAAGDERGAALAAGPLGQFAMLRGDRERANTFLTEAKDHGEDWQASLYHCRIARQRIADGDYAAARAQLRLALEVSRAVQDQFTALVTQYTWAVCAVAENDPADARGHLVEGLAMAAPAGDEAAVAQFLSAVADLDSRHGDLERAVRLEAAAQALRTPSNEMWMRAFVAPWPATGPGRAAVRAQLGPDGFDGAWRDGEQLGVDRAVAEATAGR